MFVAVGALLAAVVCFRAARRSSSRALVLSRAGLPDVARPGRGVPATLRRRVIRVGLSILGVGAALLVVGPVGAVLAAGIAVVVPRAVRRRRAGTGRSALESQLASALAGVAAALRAGLSLSQAIRFAAGEAESPVREALRHVVEREDLGLSLDESLTRWGSGSSSGDVRLVADVLRLHIGSGLPLVLDDACRALREREDTRREVRSLTAQARLSGTILGLLPIGFFVFLSVVSRHDMAAAYSTPAGAAAIVAGLVLDGLAFAVIRKLVTVRA